MRYRSLSVKLIAFTVVLAAAIAYVGTVPAAAVSIGGTDYALFARCQIGMEDGATTITGNIAVNEICGAQNGFLRVGAHNVVNGTATANRMFFGTASTVTTCEFNALTGGNAANACGNIPPDPVPPGATLPITSWPPITPPASVVPGATDFVCAATTTCNLPAGQYRDIRVRDDATLNLDGGIYQARNLFLENGSTLNGNGSAVNLTATFNTEPNATINDVNITSIFVGTAEVIEVGNNSKVNNSVLFAPAARAHLHQATITQGTEVIAVLIVVEPITVLPPLPGGTCEKSGTKFNDLAQNRTKDPGDPGLGGWVIRAYSQPGNVLVDQQTTDANGFYSFTGLACGAYTFCEVLKPGWTQTFPFVLGGNVVSCAGVDPNVTLGTRGYGETLVSGQPSKDNDFGNFQPTPPPGTEGCTPGYWKQSQHFDSWVGHATTDTAGSLFSSLQAACPALASKTLLQSLQGGGGPSFCNKVQILIRAAVAAVLNADNPNVDYPKTAAEIKTEVNNAINSGSASTVTTLATSIDKDNNLGCPLN